MQQKKVSNVCGEFESYSILLLAPNLVDWKTFESIIHMTWHIIQYRMSHASNAGSFPPQKQMWNGSCGIVLKGNLMLYLSQLLKTKNKNKKHSTATTRWTSKQISLEQSGINKLWHLCTEVGGKFSQCVCVGRNVEPPAKWGSCSRLCKRCTYTYMSMCEKLPSKFTGLLNCWTGCR